MTKNLLTPYLNMNLMRNMPSQNLFTLFYLYMNHSDEDLQQKATPPSTSFTLHFTKATTECIQELVSLLALSETLMLFDYDLGMTHTLDYHAPTSHSIATLGNPHLSLENGY